MASASSLNALLTLLREGSSRFTLKFFAILAVSGLANAALLATINGAADQAADDASRFRYLAIFLLVVTAYVIAQRHILTTSVAEVERILHGIRERLAGSMRRASLLGLERIGRAEIYGSLHRETVTISQATSTVVMSGQAMIMVIFSLAYLAWLSLAAFLLTILATGVAVFLHFRRSGEMSRLLREAHTIENRFFSTLTHVLDGFKEVKLHEPRGRALGGAVSDISVEPARGQGAGGHGLCPLPDFRPDLHLHPAGLHRVPAAALRGDPFRRRDQGDRVGPVHHRAAVDDRRQRADRRRRPPSRPRTSASSKRASTRSRPSRRTAQPRAMP